MNEKYKKIGLLSVISLSFIPFLIFVKHPDSFTFSFDNLNTIWVYIAGVSGYIGTALILWQYILGTRSVSGLIFKDLPWILKLHRVFGKYGILLFLLHPIALIFYFSESVFYTIIPDLTNQYETITTYGRIAFIAIVFIWLSSVILRSKITYRPWKYIHYLSYIALPLVFLHVPKIGLSFDEPVIRVMWWSFTIIFLIFTVLRLRFVFGFGKTNYKVLSNKRVSSDVYIIELQSGSKSQVINTGQYIYIKSSFFGESHPFTIYDYDNDKGTIKVAYKIIGKFTKGLKNIIRGDFVTIDGPYGVFTKQIDISPDYKSLVFIASGVGIAPFYKYIVDSKYPNNIMLFYANKTKETAVFRSILKDKLGDNYIDIVSRDKSQACICDERGRICEKILKKYIMTTNNHHYFICGNQGVIDTAKNSLIAIGVSPNLIHSEEFGF
jgi:predicted ferric reductase